jgi:hypothetical protein
MSRTACCLQGFSGAWCTWRAAWLALQEAAWLAGGWLSSRHRPGADTTAAAPAVQAAVAIGTDTAAAAGAAGQ